IGRNQTAWCSWRVGLRHLSGWSAILPAKASPGSFIFIKRAGRHALDYLPMRCSIQLFSLFGLALAACGSSSEAGGPTRGTTTGTGTGGVPLDPPYTGPSGSFSSKTPCPIPAAWPSRSDEIAIAYDSKRGKVFLFPHDAGGKNAELWDWDGTAATFTQRTPCSFVGSLTPVGGK